MRTIDSIRRSGVGVRPEQTIGQAAEIMERAGVGSLAVVDGTSILGIVTDRDLVRRALARNLTRERRIDTVMSSPVATIEADTDIHEAFARIREQGVRRLAVVRDGHFVGLLSADDLLVELAGDLSALSSTIWSEIHDPDRDGKLAARG